MTKMGIYEELVERGLIALVITRIAGLPSALGQQHLGQQCLCNVSRRMVVAALLRQQF